MDSIREIGRGTADQTDGNGGYSLARSSIEEYLEGGPENGEDGGEFH